MLNRELQRWMMNNHFQESDLTAENEIERTNNNVFFPIVGPAAEKTVNELFEQHTVSPSEDNDEQINGLAIKKEEQPIEESFFHFVVQSASKKEDEITQSQDEVHDELDSELEAEKKEQPIEVLFLHADALPASEEIETIPLQNEDHDELDSELEAEKKEQPIEVLFLHAEALPASEEIEPTPPQDEDQDEHVSELEAEKKEQPIEVLFLHTDALPASEEAETTPPQNEDHDELLFNVAALVTSKEAETIPLQNEDKDALVSGLAAEEKEQSNDELLFNVAALVTSKEAEAIPLQNEDKDALVSGLAAEEKEQPIEESFFHVAALSASEEVENTQPQDEGHDEIFSDLITGEKEHSIEKLFSYDVALSTNSVFVDNSDETMVDLSSQSQQVLLSQSDEETSYNEPLLLTKESESTPVQENDKGDLFDALSSNEASIVETRENLSKNHVDSCSRIKEAANDDRSDINTTKEAVKSEDLATLSGEELYRSYEEKKARAAAFAEEYRESQKLISEQNGKIRKRNIIWLGFGFISVFVLTISTVLFFYFGITEDQPNGYNSSIIAGTSSDNNSNGLEAMASGSNDLNSTSSDIANQNEESNNDVLDLENKIKTTGEVVASGLEQNERTAEAESKDLIVINIPDDKEKADIKDTINNMKTASNKTVRASKPASVMRRATITGNKRVNYRSPVNSAENSSQRDVRLSQNRVFSYIESERYFEAINLAKSNLERNPKDRLSFFSLGIAFYATLDFQGATKAFSACLTINKPNLPDFLVEELDSDKSLEDLFINYPGVESLIRSVELNPQDKSLYLNIFLSNLQSEKPIESSEIFDAISSHAEKHGSNRGRYN